MAAYTKADYYASYATCPRGVYTYPDGHTEPRRFTEIRLHYHPTVIKPAMKTKLDLIAKKYQFDANSRVLVFGSGFGWLCEELESRYGCATIGIDTSTYILDNKDLSPDDELLEAIQAAGLTTTEDPGKQIWEQFKHPTARTTANITNLDLRDPKSRNQLKRDFGIPTHIITEEVWQTLTDTERTDYQAAFDDLGAQVIHVIDWAVI